MATCTWHKTDQAKIEKWLETANHQKCKSHCSNFNSGLDCFHIYGEYIASSFEFVSSRTPEKNPFEKVYFYVF